jgi:hypothetical protein
MMAPGYFGLQFVGWMGVAMVLFGISGLVLWWPKKGQWRLAFGVKKGARGLRLNRDLHGAAGFWSLTVFLILSISGVDLAFPVTFQNIVGAVLPLDSGVADGTLDEATIASIANRNALTIDDAAKLARAAVPNARLLSIQLPPGGGGVYMVALNPEPYGNGAPQISAFVGPGAESPTSSIRGPTRLASASSFGCACSTTAMALDKFGRCSSSYPGFYRSCLASPAFACGNSNEPGVRLLPQQSWHPPSE